MQQCYAQATVFTTLASTAEPQITDETMLANIEALSSGENTYVKFNASDRIDCESQIDAMCGMVRIGSSGNGTEWALHAQKKVGWAK